MKTYKQKNLELLSEVASLKKELSDLYFKIESEKNLYKPSPDEFEELKSKLNFVKTNLTDLRSLIIKEDLKQEDPSQISISRVIVDELLRYLGEPV